MMSLTCVLLENGSLQFNNTVWVYKMFYNGKKFTKVTTLNDSIISAVMQFSIESRCRTFISAPIYEAACNIIECLLNI